MVAPDHLCPWGLKSYATGFVQCDLLAQGYPPQPSTVGANPTSPLQTDDTLNLRPEKVRPRPTA